MNSNFGAGAGMVRASIGAAMATVVLATCVGCAAPAGANPRDPLEGFNRGVFSFNEALDKALLKPAATAYQDVVPQLVRTGVSNFLGNLDDIWSFVNSALQFKAPAAAQNFMRFHVNTVFGVGGVFDVASDLRLERQREDFGQTLAVWGVATGPYIVLPFFGPGTLRDLVAWPVDMQGDLVSAIAHVPTRNTLKALDLLDIRSSLLGFGTAVDAVAFDKYTFTRDAFLQRRRNAVYDGNPPDEKEGDSTAP